MIRHGKIVMSLTLAPALSRLLARRAERNHFMQ